MITEPSTLFTDYLLAGVTCWLGLRLLRSAEISVRLWAVAFLALALTALLGGTFHGFGLPLWKATVLSAGLVSFAMVAGSAVATTSGRVRRLVIAFAVVKLVVYEAWMASHDDYIYVIADTGIALAIVALLHRRSWILAGVVVSVIAGAVQASGFDLHPHFNHNDLYHVIQIAAMFLFYRGVTTMRRTA
jgi:hypothetical protein